MHTPQQYMRKSAACFRKLVRSHDLNTLECTFLSILAHALWEKGVELEGPPAATPSRISPIIGLLPLRVMPAARRPRRWGIYPSSASA
jgi:hypothetical protein